MSPALFLFELLKMSKLTRGPLVLYHLPKVVKQEKIEAKMWEKNIYIISRFQEHTYILRPQAKCL